MVINTCTLGAVCHPVAVALQEFLKVTCFFHSINLCRLIFLCPVTCAGYCLAVCFPARLNSLAVTLKLGKIGAALILVQGVMRVMEQKEEASDAQLKRSVTEVTNDFRAKIAKNST